MKVHLEPAPWHTLKPSIFMLEAVLILSKSLWREAATDFHAQRTVKLQLGKRPPQGAQQHLNTIIDREFSERGWMGEAGRFWKEDVWVRTTFRHQMSLGADFLDAIRVHKKEGISQCAVFAAGKDFLNVITPNDAGGLVSYEKLRIQCMELDGCISTPLFLGRLQANEKLSPEVSQSILASRPRRRRDRH